MIIRVVFFFLGLLTAIAGYCGDGINKNAEKSQKIRQEMWEDCKDYFKGTEIPEKWNEEPAVIIGRDIRLSYKKDFIVNNLRYNYYSHNRIKLLGKAAVEKYSAYSIPGSRGGSQVYAGFKVVKADGTERIISMDDLAEEKAEYNNREMEIYKLAIPDLEEGDIIDYYLAEERTIPVYGKFYSFDPVILELNDEYPIMKQQIAFDVLRRCYINMKSLNGAPEFKLSTDEGDDDVNRYVLTDENRERVDEMMWFYPYREVPTIKFKVTYASMMAAEYYPFLGKSGELKSKIFKTELGSFVKTLFQIGSPVELKKLMKRNYAHLTDNMDIARTSFYLLRYLTYVKGAEKFYLNGAYANKGSNFIRQLSAYYRMRNINHTVLIGIPRRISDLEDLILENELNFAIKVEQGDEVYYISIFDENAYFGELDPSFQGTRVYGTKTPTVNSGFEEFTLPIWSSEKNKVDVFYNYSISDLSEGKINLIGKKIVNGNHRERFQGYLMDFYTFKDEERKMHPYHEEFEGTYSRQIPELKKKQEEIRETRKEEFEDRVKTVLENDMPEIKVEEIRNFQVLQTGRFDDKPEFIYEFEADIEGPIKKVGPNYLLDIGKLIDSQLEIPEEQEIRQYNVYMEFARSYDYTVRLQLPEGYEVQGMDKLQYNTTNSTGGFICSARVEDNLLVLEGSKIYYSNYEPVENWSMMLEFIEAANEFENSQILLKKIN